MDKKALVESIVKVADMLDQRGMENNAAALDEILENVASDEMNEGVEEREMKIGHWVDRVLGTLDMIQDDYDNRYHALNEAIRRVKVPDVFREQVWKRVNAVIWKKASVKKVADDYYRQQQSFNRAQRAYDAMMPPEYDEVDPIEVEPQDIELIGGVHTKFPIGKIKGGELDPNSSTLTFKIEKYPLEQINAKLEEDKKQYGGDEEPLDDAILSEWITEDLNEKISEVNLPGYWTVSRRKIQVVKNAPQEMEVEVNVEYDPY